MSRTFAALVVACLFSAALIPKNAIAQLDQRFNDRVSLSIEWTPGPEGVSLPQLDATARNQLISSPALNGLAFYKMMIALQRGRQPDFERTFTTASVRTDFNVDYPLIRRSYLIRGQSDTIEYARNVLLSAIAPYLYPGVEALSFDCIDITIEWPPQRNEGRECYNYQPGMLLNRARRIPPIGRTGGVPLQFGEWRRQLVAGVPSYNEYLEITSAHLNIVYANADSFSVTPLRSSAPTLLAVAAEVGNVDAINALAAAGANPNARSVAGETPIHFATMGNSIPSVNRLVELGAGVDVVSDSGRTAIHIAADSSYARLVPVLAGHGADVNRLTNDSLTPLHIATQNVSSATVSALVAAGANPSIGDASGITPLMLAASRTGVLITADNLEIVRTLIQTDAPVDQADDAGLTALHHAARADNLDVIKMLLEAGASVNQKTSEGKTALHYSASDGSVATISHLLNSGADVDARTNDEQTPLMFSSSRGREGLAYELIDSGADVEAKDNRGNTPLMYAAGANRRDMVIGLLKRGASKRTRNLDGKNARGVAMQNRSENRNALTVFQQIQTIQFAPIKLGVNLSRLVDPQLASSFGAELGMVVSLPLVSNLRVQADVGTVVRVTEPNDEADQSIFGGGDRYYFISTVEARPQLRFDFGNTYRRHPYLLAGIGLGGVMDVELRDYSGQFDEEVVTDNSDESFTTLNVGIGWQGAAPRSTWTFELTYSRVASMKLDRFEGPLTTIGFAIGFGL